MGRTRMVGERRRTNNEETAREAEDEEERRRRESRLEVVEEGRGKGLLKIRNLREGDQGLYTCRVDFRHQPTKTTRVGLTVVGQCQ